MRSLLDVDFTPGPRLLFSPISALGVVLHSYSLNPGTQWFWKWRHEAYFNRSHDVIAFVPWIIGSPTYSEVWKTVRNAYQEIMDTEGWTRRNELVFDEINSLVLKFTFIIICRCGFAFSTPWSATRSETDNFPDAFRLVSETLIPRLVVPNWMYSLPFERLSGMNRA
ncbi:hypothetical protein ACEPAH_4022 [Sanghuangporus vaninii]